LVTRRSLGASPLRREFGWRFFDHGLLLLPPQTKSACRVGREVAHPGPSPDPDERISRIRLFRRCGSGLRVSPTFRSPGDMLSHVNAWGMVPS